jgi:hypothetical protein
MLFLKLKNMTNTEFFLQLEEVTSFGLATEVHGATLEGCSFVRAGGQDYQLDKASTKKVMRAIETHLVTTFDEDKKDEA